MEVDTRNSDIIQRIIKYRAEKYTYYRGRFACFISRNFGLIILLFISSEPTTLISYTGKLQSSMRTLSRVQKFFYSTEIIEYLVIINFIYG